MRESVLSIFQHNKTPNRSVGVVYTFVKINNDVASGAQFKCGSFTSTWTTCLVT